MIFGYRVSAQASVEDAWNELAMHEIIPLYTSETEDAKAIWLAQALPEGELEQLASIDSFYGIQTEDIDWNEQWTQGGQKLINGCLAIQEAGCIVYLKPGPGFGDASHPTTRLILRMMASSVHDKVVADVGSGSGILAIFAAQLGARAVYGIEIDPEAIRHARENAVINQVDAAFMLPEQFSIIPEVILMNMISSEQEIAWGSLSTLHGIKAEILVSGIPEEEKQAYLNVCQERGWQLVDCLSEDGWLAFKFYSSSEAVKK